MIQVLNLVVGLLACGIFAAMTLSYVRVRRLMKGYGEIKVRQEVAESLGRRASRPDNQDYLSMIYNKIAVDIMKNTVDSSDDADSRDVTEKFVRLRAGETLRQAALLEKDGTIRGTLLASASCVMSDQSMEALSSNLKDFRLLPSPADSVDPKPTRN